ncbi:MAG: DNA cytosine methyltransferase [Alphaproteobacteria bacterium]|nr:DNA cytosine methyltransferase [Alphaproteobacteria bacterium]MCB9793484.1 DNA cytosine methyltransferase [Alphaproteobacteria bacterium]
MRSVELFAGAGGLALGLAQAGLHHVGIVEWNHWACETIRANRARGFHLTRDWPEPFEGDVRNFDYAGLSGVRVVSGGPPCQPFSIGGKHKGYDDKRDMFPEAIRAVRELEPDAFIFENVRGLLRQAFSHYLRYIVLRLESPRLVQEPGEGWEAHLARLEARRAAGEPPEYQVNYRELDAADLGVPQRRHRVVFVGFKRSLGARWSFPEPSHGLDALLHAQWVSGTYWEEHQVARRHRPELPERWTRRVERLRVDGVTGQRWQTVRDALRGLPEPSERQASLGPGDHFLQAGARSYPGHTGSPLDLPSKALKAGVHGVPGGENMLRRVDGSVRYFSVREAARLQTIPDDYGLEGPWSEAMRQLGNGVPMRLAEVVGGRVIEVLRERDALAAK